MIVVDASCLTALVAGTVLEVESATAAVSASDHWVVPGHALVETMSALRGLYLGGVIDRETMADCAQQLSEFRLDVWPTEPLLGRMIELADNMTAYDAAYVALAEELAAPLVTADKRIAGVPRLRCPVVVTAVSDSR